MNYLRKILKKNKTIHTLYFFALNGWASLKPRMVHLFKIKLFLNFYKDYKNYRDSNANKNFTLSPNNLYPCLYDNTGNTQVNYTYFYQDAWCAKKVFENKPEHHYDVGSNSHMVAIISQFTKTTMLDIRPLDVELPGLSFRKADIIQTGLPDNSIASLSSICVLEHIGLGRYGDSIDPFGTEKSAKEIKRILSQNGNLYISLPVDYENKVYFNAHRAFTKDYVLKIFSPLKLIEEKYIYGSRMFDSYDKSKGFGTGMFHFKK